MQTPKKQIYEPALTTLCPDRQERIRRGNPHRDLHLDRTGFVVRIRVVIFRVRTRVVVFAGCCWCTKVE